MAKISLNFNSKNNDLGVKVDGQELEDVGSLSFYRYPNYEGDVVNSLELVTRTGDKTSSQTKMMVWTWKNDSADAAEFEEKIIPSTAVEKLFDIVLKQEGE